MKKENFKAPMEQDIPFLFKHSSPQQIKELISELSFKQIESGIAALRAESTSSRLLSAIEGVEEIRKLELIGSFLSAEQFSAILRSISEHKTSIDKLSPLLVGLPPSVFFESLQKAQDIHLESLKKEGILEPLEHHINLLFNTFETTLQKYQEKTEEIHRSIEEINSNFLTYSDLRSLENQIENLKGDYQATLDMIDKALAIIWNTHRLDLIEKLSQLKERASLQLIHNIGPDRPLIRDSDGLTGLLKKFLNQVYENHSDRAGANRTPDAEDDEKSLEGLTRLSIWYLNDYWEAGLLPEIKKPENLEPASLHSEEEKLHHRQQLFDRVQSNLEHLGIETVGKLKKAQIFSKLMLKEFIEKHKNVLKSDPKKMNR